MHRASRRWLTILLAVSASLAGLVIALAPAAVAAPATPPPNPTDQQLSTAQGSTSSLAGQVGVLSAQLSQLTARADQAKAAVLLAEQKVALAVAQLQDAQAAATAAKVNVAAAQVAVDQARSRFNSFIRRTYETGSLQAPSAALLTSRDPTTMLQSAALQTYVANHQLDGIGQLQRATVAKANADAAARAAVDRQASMRAQAEAAQSAAADAAASAAAQQQQTKAQQGSVQAQLDTAQATLLGLQNQRAAYDAWKAEQARIQAAQEAARQAALLAQQRAAAAQAAQAAQSRPSAPPNNGGASSAGGNAGPAPVTVSSGNPGGGAWSAAKAQNAVNRAMSYLGTPYSWAAGNSQGPTYGVCGTGGAGNNDCHVYGFDCSGLTMYAWGPYISLTHYAATQYTQAGSYHPGTGQLQPGDLVFWSGDGTIAGIYHMAMYIGNGNVIQAPESGEVIRVTNLWNVTSGYYGATRPLT